ncbi:MAG: DUF805 domain-containing protein [Rikenellaceae bacterium]
MNWFLDILKNKYADFSGRARRKEFWSFVLFYFIFSLVAMTLDNMLGITFGHFSSGPISGLFSIALLIPSLAVTVRRLHDIGKSGWMILVGLIPVVGTIWLLVLLFTEGTSASNEYGPDPKVEITAE